MISYIFQKPISRRSSGIKGEHAVFIQDPKKSEKSDPDPKKIIGHRLVSLLQTKLVTLYFLHSPRSQSVLQTFL